MPFTPTNWTETPISGSFGRVAISIDGVTLYYVNLTHWLIIPRRENVSLTHGESAGWGFGVSSITEAEIQLAGPYQLIRSGGFPAPGMEILNPGIRFYYELHYVHTDYNKLGLMSLRPWIGVAEVISTPSGHSAEAVADVVVQAITRGPIFRPSAPFFLSPTNLIAFFGTSFYTTGIPLRGE